MEALWRAGPGLHARFQADDAGDRMQLRRRLVMIGAGRAALLLRPGTEG